MSTVTTGRTPGRTPTLVLTPLAGNGGRSRELLDFKQLRASGDSTLRDQLVKRYLGLASRLAQRYPTPRHLSDEDVLQVARMGLVKAVDRFDPDRGLAFSTFAAPTILGEIKRYFRYSAWATHVSRHLQETSLAIERAASRLAMRDGHRPTVTALAAELEISVREVMDGVQAGRDAISFDAPTKREDGASDGSLLETVGRSEPGYELALDRSALREAARSLSDRERFILKLRFEQDLTQQQIAERIGVSQMQVSRLLRRSLPRLREAAG